MKKQGLFLMSTLLILSLILSGCHLHSSPSQPTLSASSDNQPSISPTEVVTPAYKDNTWQGNNEPISLTLASSINMRNNMPLWGDDTISRMVMNLTGVKLELIYAADDYYEKSMVDTMIASQEYADIIHVSTETDIDKLLQAEGALAIDQLAQEYCPDLWNNLDPIEQINNQSSDGHIYALRKGYRTDAFYNDPTIPCQVPYTLSLRSDILNALDADMPQSIDELNSLLYQVKNVGEQLKITVPLRITGVLDTPISGWMGLSESLQWHNPEQKIKLAYTDESWLAYFRMMNQWHQDGILGLPEIGTRWTEYFSGNIESSFATAYSQQQSMGTSLLYKMRIGTESHATPFPYVLITEPLSYQGTIKMIASDVDIGNGNTSVHSGALLIGRSCMKQNRAVQFLQYLTSDEGAMLTSWGIKDTHYTLGTDAKLTYLDQWKYPEDTVFSSGQLDLRTQEGVAYWLLFDKSAITGKITASESEYYSNNDRIALREMEISYGLKYKELVQQNRNPVLHFAELSENHPFYEQYQQIQSLWNDTAYKMVTAHDSDEIDILWNSMQEEFQQLGLSNIESTMTEQYKSALIRYQKAGYFTETEIK